MFLFSLRVEELDLKFSYRKKLDILLLLLKNRWIFGSGCYWNQFEIMPSMMPSDTTISFDFVPMCKYDRTEILNYGDFLSLCLQCFVVVSGPVKENSFPIITTLLTPDVWVFHTKLLFNSLRIPVSSQHRPQRLGAQSHKTTLHFRCQLQAVGRLLTLLT